MPGTSYGWYLVLIRMVPSTSTMVSSTSTMVPSTSTMVSSTSTMVANQRRTRLVGPSTSTGGGPHQPGAIRLLLPVFKSSMVAAKQDAFRLLLIVF